MNAKKIVEADYIVIGAGIAGLGAATYLREQGKKVTVLESKPNPGGRMHTDKSGDTPYDIGAQFIDSSYQNIIRYSKKYGLKPKRVPVSRMGIYDDGQAHMLPPNPGGLLVFKGLSPSKRLGFLAAMPRVALARPKIDIYNLRSGLAFDKTSAEEYLKAKLSKEAREEVLDPLIHGLAFFSLRDISATFIKAFLAKLMLIKPLTYQTGIGALSELLASKLDIHYNQVVKTVERMPKMVVVQANTTTYHAKKIIMAVPGTEVLGMLKNPNQAEKQFFPKVKYSSTIIAHCRAKAFMGDKKYALFFKPHTKSPLAAIHHNPYSKTKGYDNFIVTLSSERAQELLSQEITASHLQEIIEPVLGHLDNFELLDVTKWPSAVSMPSPGYLTELYAFQDATANEGRLFYAGDYIGGGYTEMAFTSGLDAAKQAIQE